MRVKTFLISIGLFLGVIALPTPLVLAADNTDIICGDLEGSNAEISEQCRGADSSLPETLIKWIVRPLLFIAGAGAVVMVIVGGLRFVTSAGNQDAVKSARATILAALIGLAISILALAIVNYALDTIGG